MASSSIVIKVKFGEILRRFNALVLGNELALDVVTLREKIRSLFSFAPDVDFTLTYIDEDGDVITLADEDDLRDVVRQSLNPLRISVRLNTDKFGVSYAGSSGSSSPLRSSLDQLPFQALSSGIPEVFRSVPEPFRDALSKLSLDLTAKAATSAPGLAELIEKMKMTYLNQLSDSQAGSRASTPGGTKDNTMSAPNIKDQQGLKSVTFDNLPDTSSKLSTKDGKVPMDHEVGSSNSKNKAEQFENVTEGLKLQDIQPPRPVDLNVPYFGYETSQSQVNNKGVIGSGRRSYSEVVTVGAEKKVESGVEKLPGVDKKKDVSGETSDGVQVKPVGFGAPNTTEIGGAESVESSKATNDPCIPSWLDQGMLSATSQYPFEGMPPSNDTNWHAYHHARRGPNFKRSYNHGNGMGSIFHRGVRCDGCGVHPITGPRFKSKAKDDYDLCSICFAEMGNGADYIRLDRPASHRHAFPFKGFYDHSHRLPTPVLPHILRAPGTKLSRSKLDSRFILDVNVLDGTVMAPSTKFTKIWRMRNNGGVIWPQGSQLMWIGGDRLSNAVSVEVEIPAEGLPVNQELDIAVDFTAPELPGRYISYWRMASPSGQKFGQRVWVLIQVDASMKDLGETSINLNLPSVSSGRKNPEVADMKGDREPLLGSILPENNFVRVMEAQDPFFSALPTRDQEMNFPVNNTLIIDNGGVSSTTATSDAFGTGPYPSVGAASSSVSYPTIEVDPANLDSVVYPTMDFSEVPPAGPTTAELPSAVVQPSASILEAASDGNLDREQALLRELEEMGFKQLDLNKEILRMNEYDLERSVGDLCGVYEWDPMLEELQEMGFSDTEANKRLLKKNNGSIKRVVMDLINGERA